MWVREALEKVDKWQKSVGVTEGPPSLAWMRRENNLKCLEVYLSFGNIGEQRYAHLVRPRLELTSMSCRPDHGAKHDGLVPRAQHPRRGQVSNPVISSPRRLSIRRN